MTELTQLMNNFYKHEAGLNIYQLCLKNAVGPNHHVASC